MQALFKSDCLLCGDTTNLGSEDFCSPCRRSLPYLARDHCNVCAVPLTGSSICGACLAKPPAFDHCVASLEYAFPIDALLHALKYRANLALSRVLADLLVARIKSIIDAVALPDFIVPMPLHPTRLQERGFNQALEIARRVSKSTGVPLLPDACQRIRDTPSQTRLAWKAREQNIRGAFTSKADLSGKRIAVLDDVMTTGASLNELAKILRRRGATHVAAWVVARTLPGGLSPPLHNFSG